MTHPLALTLILASSALAAEAPMVPRIDFVVPIAKQPHAGKAARTTVIWFDDFDDDSVQARYAEKSGETTDTVRLRPLMWSLASSSTRPPMPPLVPPLVPRRAISSRNPVPQISWPTSSRPRAKCR